VGIRSGDPLQISVGLIVPLGRGGSLSIWNLRALCSDCAEGLQAAPYLPRPTAATLIQALEQLGPEDQAWISQRLAK
jgi:hypothetical protein